MKTLFVLFYVLSFTVSVFAGKNQKPEVLNSVADSLSPIGTDDKDATSDTQVPDIRDIPRLRAGLAPGTIAWATYNQIHPTQPQVGYREIARKLKSNFEKRLKKNPRKFSQRLYEFCYRYSVSPAYVAKTPQTDSRHETEAVLAYITDRTHGSDAQSEMILKYFGEDGLSKVIYDHKGRPLNFILVRVTDDLTQLDLESFQNFMVQGEHAYLKSWSRGHQGKTRIETISFDQLPEKLMQTSDNPFRSLISQLQLDHVLERVPTDFSQFIDAEGLVRNKIVDWDEIDAQASKKDLKRALRAATDFFKSKNAYGLPGVSSKNASHEIACKDLFNERP